MPIPQIPGVPQIDPLTGAPIEPVPVDPYAPVPVIPPIVPGQGPPPELALTPEPQAPPQGFDVQGEPYQEEYLPIQRWFPSLYDQGQPDAISGAGEPVDTAPPTIFDGGGEQAPQGVVGTVVPAQPQRQGSGDPYIDSLAETSDMRMRAAQMKADAEKEKNDYLAAETARRNDQLALREAKRETERRENFEQAKLKTATLAQEATDLANTKIDENAVWNDMSFGAKLALGIAAALNGWTDPRGPNRIGDHIAGLVARNIEVQKHRTAARAST
jgi:hypothetical protein